MVEEVFPRPDRVVTELLKGLDLGRVAAREYDADLAQGHADIYYTQG
jgi:hypothetical protein